MSEEEIGTNGTTMPAPFSLAGKVAIVTGSSTGLGKATAMCIGKAGAKVALNYANVQSRAESALEELRAAGLSLIHI